MLASVTVSGRADLSFAYTYDANKNVIEETSTGSAMGSYSWKTVNTNNDDGPFDYGFRQKDGSYVHADEGGPKFNVRMSPSVKEFTTPYRDFNIDVFCVRCSPCKR